MSVPNRLNNIDFTAINVQTLATSAKSSADIVAGVVTVACVKIRNLTVEDSLELRINPGVPLPEEFTRRSGIYPSNLENSPTLEEALPELAAFVGRDVIVWAPSSQKMTAVHRHFKLTQARDRQFYLQSLAEKALPELTRHNLTTLANHLELTPFGLPHNSAFSASESARLTAQIWIQLLQNLAQTRQIDSLDALLKFCPASNARTFRTRKELAFDRAKLRFYPTQPGVYFMKNRLGEILYIGKAKNLRNRLRSYFQKQSRLPSKIAAMMKQVAQIDVTVVGSELEALLLESRLIKEHMPFFNKKIKDYKRMLFLKVSVNQDFPRISDASETEDPHAAYFGPFAGKSVMRYKMEILNRVFKLRECSDKTFAEHSKSPCMQYHLGFCSGPCAGLINQADYQDGVKDFLNYLEQKPSLAIDYLLAKRNAYIEDLQFEKASILHQQWEAMDRLQLQNYQLHHALTEHHCLIILPDTQPNARRILTVLHGQPVQWNSVPSGETEAPAQQELEEIITNALTGLDNPIEISPTHRPTIAKSLYEEARLITQWLNQHTDDDGAVVYLKDKSPRQILSELQLALCHEMDAATQFSRAGQTTHPNPDHEFEDGDEAWQWEQAMESL